MKAISYLFLFIFCPSAAWSQDQLVKDLDHDTVNDTVYLDRQATQIVCRLSTQPFKKIQSKNMDMVNETAGVRPTKNGFEFYNNWMRAGYGSQFRYDVKTKKLQLIGMSRYEFGNATNDGSGESSVNLLTHDYLGNWNYFDPQKEKLVKIPTIKAKMVLGKIFLDTFSDKTYFTYAEKCAALYEKNRGGH